jgi:heat shock protein HslJ
MSKKSTILLVLAILVLAGFWLLSHDNSTEIPADNSVNESTTESSTEENEEMDPSQALIGTWVWQETIMNNGEVIEPDDVDAFTVNFTQSGTVNITTDCNNANGPYSVDGNSLSIGPLAMTRMFCEGSQETEFTDMLTSDNTYMIDDSDQLVIMLPVDSGSVILTSI